MTSTLARQVALDEGEVAFGASSPIGPVLAIVLSGELTVAGDASKATRDDGIWRVAALGELSADATLKSGDVFAIGAPGCARQARWTPRSAGSAVHTRALPRSRCRRRTPRSAVSADVPTARDARDVYAYAWAGPGVVP